MIRRRFLATGIFGLGARLPRARAAATTTGTDPRFSASVATRIGDRTVRMILTGTAMRTKYRFRVYAIGSYVDESVRVRDADSLARVAAPKQLHLIFERAVDGATIAKSFRESIGMSHPAPAFSAELTKLERYFLATPVKQGDHVWLTFVPGYGLGCQVNGHPVVVIEGVAFAQAAWGTYLGRHNLGVAIKDGLTSQLR